MPREVEPSLNERQFIRDALFESIRLDGRQLDQFRNLDLQFGDDYGVADVRLGKTRCVPPSHKTEETDVLLNYIQSGSKNIRRSNDTLPRSQIRWRLHHLDRTLTHGLSRL
jgi:hypothetical protein